MLTKELLKFRRSGGFKPVFINPAEPERQKLASELIGVYQGAFDSRMGRGEIEELTDVLIKGTRDQIFASGLNKLLLDHTDFDPVREIDYPALRGELFAFASEKLVEAQGDVARYRELLATRPGLIEFMAGDIYGDLPDNERISAAPKLTATELLNRYNLAQVQGLLIYAESIELEVRDEHPAELRRLFKYLKFFRLLAEIRRKGRGKSVAYELSISGPFSLFANTRKYALQLAAFFPAVVNLAQWKLKAKIRLGKLSGDLKLDQEAGLVSHYRNFSSYVPEEIRMFHSLFNKAVASSRTIGESPFIDGGKQSVVFPDLSFERVGDGVRVHLELFHRWHRGQLEGRLELLREHPELPLVLGIDRALADDEAFAELERRYPELVDRIYRFRDFPGVDRTLRVLERFAGERKG